ncbi:hypothetical protein J6590_004035 [Homalodisca vitripennis]|nr:hypothetical protein J6590_004035 [Homalodisca vitripennis]
MFNGPAALIEPGVVKGNNGEVERRGTSGLSVTGYSYSPINSVHHRKMGAQKLSVNYNNGMSKTCQPTEIHRVGDVDRRWNRINRDRMSLVWIIHLLR